MLLEYAYDTATRLSHGLWRQEHPADAIEFPYSLLKARAGDGQGRTGEAEDVSCCPQRLFRARAALCRSSEASWTTSSPCGCQSSWRRAC
jgi:hypothetical protein